MSAASYRIDAAISEIRNGRVRLCGSGRMPDADEHFARLLQLLSNAIWHEDTNGGPGLGTAIREQTELVAEALSRTRRSDG